MLASTASTVIAEIEEEDADDDDAVVDIVGFW